MFDPSVTKELFHLFTTEFASIISPQPTDEDHLEFVLIVFPKINEKGF
jgi:hypothetical protein